MRSRDARASHGVDNEISSASCIGVPVKFSRKVSLPRIIPSPDIVKFASLERKFEFRIRLTFLYPTTSRYNS